MIISIKVFCNNCGWLNTITINCEKCQNLFSFTPLDI